MYIRKHFQAASDKDVWEFVHSHPFGILVHSTKEGPIATHIPMDLISVKEEEYYLTGHLARANPQAKYILDETKAMAIFSHGHSYISSAWYEKKSVPTWNYIAIHAYGCPRPIREGDYFDFLARQVDKYEKGSPKPEKLDEAPVEMVRALIKGVVAFTMKIEKTDTAFKLSQNKSAKDRKEIILQLELSDDHFSRWVGERMAEFPY